MSATWEPANDVERSMEQALAEADTGGYFRTVAIAPLVLPAFLGDQAAGHQRMFTWEVDGETYLLVFTSVAALIACLGESAADGFATTRYRELVEKWPDRRWRLAIDPGSPISAFVEVATVVQAALDEAQVPPPVGAADVFERGIQAGVDGGDRQLLLDSLLLSIVLVPIAGAASADALGRPDFPWLLAEDSPDPTISVFTSASLMTAYDGDATASYVQVDFIDVLREWPDPTYRLAVNPGSDLAVTFDAAEIPGLLNWWDDLAERDDA